MKRTDNLQVNTKTYWNYIYTTPAKKAEYWSSTRRFPEAIKYVKDGDKFLDIGCGVGIPGRMIKKMRKGCEIWGVDISDEIIKNNKIDDKDIKYFQGYVGQLKGVPEKYFDVVFSGETLEHLDEPADLVRDGYRTLKKGGKFIITTPHGEEIKSPEHTWYFEKDDIEDLFFTAGFKDIKFVELGDMEHLVIIFAIGTK